MEKQNPPPEEKGPPESDKRRSDLVLRGRVPLAGLLVLLGVLLLGLLLERSAGFSAG